jgi:hypothetical protein
MGDMTCKQALEEIKTVYLPAHNYRSLMSHLHRLNYLTHKSCLI